MIKRFAMGSVLGGVAMSAVACFLVRNDGFGFLQLCFGYAATSCLAGLLFGGTAKMLGYPRGEPARAEMRIAWIGGVASVTADFVVWALTGNFEMQRILIFGLPPLAGLVYTLKMRRQGSRSDCPTEV